MTVAAVAPLSLVTPSITPIGAALGPALTTGAADAAGPVGVRGVDFASMLSRGLDQLQSTQTRADDLAVQAATGRLTDVHDFMIASTEASLATQLTVAVRNKALEAFNEIMRMQA